jgi:hypothetical protein
VSDCPFQIGQRVTVHGRGFERPMFVTLSNGSKWTWYGEMYFGGKSERFYTGPRIYATKDGDESVIARSALIAKLEDIRRSELEKFETAQLVAAVTALWPDWKVGQ